MNFSTDVSKGDRAHLDLHAGAGVSIAAADKLCAATLSLGAISPATACSG